MRSYDEYCAMAKALDVVGDRWTLLIVRELLLRGACRYTDLRRGLPGIATNLLAERLRDLERAGIVAREDAPPPVAASLLRLTPRGEELRPVFEHLTRWGVPLMAEQRPRDAVRSHWLAPALEMMLSDGDPDAASAVIELHVGDEPIAVEVGGGEVQAHTGPAESPDLTLTGAAMPVLGLLLGLLPRDDVRAVGVGVQGDLAVLERLGSDVRAGAAPG